MEAFHRAVSLAVRSLVLDRGAHKERGPYSSSSKAFPYAKTSPSLDARTEATLLPSDLIQTHEATQDDTTYTINTDVLCGTGSTSGFWEWETAVQGFTDLQIRRWLPLANFARSRGLHVSASMPALPAGTSFDDPRKDEERKRAFLGLPRVLSFPDGRLRLHLIQTWWFGVTVVILLLPMVACLSALLTWPSLMRPALFTWLVAEAVFLMLRAQEWTRASKEVVKQAVPSKEEVSQLLDRIIALRCMGVVQPEEFLSGWFMGAPAAALSRSGVKEFLAFGLYHRDLMELPGDIQAAVEEHLTRIEQHWGVRFTAGNSSSSFSESFSSVSTLARGIKRMDSLGADPARGSSQHMLSQTRLQPFSVPVSPSRRPSATLGLHPRAHPPLSAEGQHPASGSSSANGLLAAAVAAAQAQGLGHQDMDTRGERPGGAVTPPFMAHTKEPLRAFLHPLAFYVWGHVVGALTALVLATMGFRRKVSKSSGVVYYVRQQELGEGAAGSRGNQTQELKAPLSEPKATNLGGTTLEHSRSGEGGAGKDVDPCIFKENREEDACIFVHGLGIGLTPYLAFIRQLLGVSRHKAVAVVELPHLAYQLCASVPTVDSISCGLDEVLDDCAGPSGRASFIGHSYGTLVLAQYARTRPSRVASLGLIDPVCILLCLPYVIYNFVYKYPDFKSVKKTVGDTLRLLMCSRELNVARALCRSFNWHDLHLWAHQMPQRTVVMLGGEDSIVPSERVKKYLEAHAVPVIYNESFGHGQFLFSPERQAQFLQYLYFSPKE